MSNRSLSRLARAGLLAGAGLVSSGASAADSGPRYTFLDLGYAYVDIDDFNADGDAFVLGGSVALTDMFHIFASYLDGSVEDHSFDVDVTESIVGPGINLALSDTVDFVGQIGWVHFDADAGGFSGSDDGIGLNAGVRAMVTPVLELNGGLSYVDVGNSDDTALTVGGVYSFTPMFAGLAGVSWGDNSRTFEVGLRLYLQ